MQRMQKVIAIKDDNGWYVLEDGSIANPQMYDLYALEHEVTNDGKRMSRLWNDN